MSRDGMSKDSRYVDDVESECNSVTIVSPQFCLFVARNKKKYIKVSC